MSSDVHISPNWNYFAVFGGLMVLTAITVAVSFVDLGWANDVAAIGIAVAKATLVILFFMHVKYGTRLNKLVVLAGILWVLMMFGLTLTDYLSRQEIVRDPEGIGSSVVVEEAR
jgi:cytochrome c oxidase subunit 4